MYFSEFSFFKIINSLCFLLDPKCFFSTQSQYFLQDKAFMFQSAVFVCLFCCSHGVNELSTEEVVDASVCDCRQQELVPLYLLEL